MAIRGAITLPLETSSTTRQAIFVPTSTASQAFGNQMIQAMDTSFNVRMVPTANQGENAEPAPIMEACNGLCILTSTAGNEVALRHIVKTNRAT